MQLRKQVCVQPYLQHGPGGYGGHKASGVKASSVSSPTNSLSKRCEALQTAVIQHMLKYGRVLKPI